MRKFMSFWSTKKPGERLEELHFKTGPLSGQNIHTDIERTAPRNEPSEFLDEGEVHSHEDILPSSAVDVRNVTFTYPGSAEPVLNGLTLELARGSFTAIIGGNGCGKSTMCKLFNGLIPQFYTGDFSGEVHVLGMPVEGRNVAELSRSIGYVYQDFDNQLVRPTVLDEACFAPLNYGLRNYRELGERALAMCGLEGIQDRYIWELSGGQKHLLALAGALSMDPEILIVDEPVSQLDPQHAKQIYECLKRLNTDYGKTLIVIEHHTEFIADFCHDVVLMDQGRALWKLPVQEGLNRVSDLERLGIQPPDVTRAAMAAAKVGLTVEPVGTPACATVGTIPTSYWQNGTAPFPVTVEEAAIYFAERYILEARASRTTPDEATASDLSGQANHPKADREGYDASIAPLVRFNDTRLRYRGLGKQEHEVLRGINISLHEGERVALIGNNGAGKSSLLKLIAGIHLPQEGSVTVLGEKTNRSSMEHLAGKVAYIFQQSAEMFIQDSVRKEVGYYLKARGMKDADSRIAHMLDRFRLIDLQDRDARLLSGGQQRRVTLAIGAAMHPRLMLLDEPTANLDMATREELIGVLSELDEHVRTTVIATHDMQLVTQWASRVIVLHNGRVEADGTPADIFSDAALLRRAGLALTQIMELSHRLNMPGLCPTAEAFAARLLPLNHAEPLKKEAHHAACPQLA